MAPYSNAQNISLDEVYGQTLPDLKSFKLKDTTTPAKGYVVTFMSAVCPCSDSHMQEIKDLAHTFKDHQFLVVHSNGAESLEVATPYFTSKQIPFPVLSDPDARIANVFKALKTPHTFILNQDGEILYKGGVSNSAKFENAKVKFLRNALTQISKGQTPKPKVGRTLGCQIIRI